MRKRINSLLTLLLFWCLAWEAGAQTETWSLMHRGDRSFKAGDYKTAEVLYGEALKQDTTNVRARFNLADTYLALSDLDHAMGEYAKVVRDGREREGKLSSRAYHNMGFIEQTVAGAADEQQKQQHLRKAIEHYKDALRLNPQADESRYNLVLCQKQLKESQDQQSKDQQEDPQSQNKQQQEDQSQQQKKQQQQPDEKEGNKAPEPKPEQQDQQLDRKSEQLLNYIRQREKQTKEKINVQPRKVYRGKNW